MAVAVVNLGPNSWKVTWTTGDTAATVLTTGLNTVMTSAGWSLFDSAAGTNARCYRVANVDGSYKYIVLDVNTAGYLLTKVYESWNATTHVGTNLAYLSDNTSWVPRLSVAAANHEMYCYVHPRYAFFYSNSPIGTYGDSAHTASCGILEFEVRNPDETSANGVPPYAFVNTYKVFGNDPTWQISFVRNPYTQTGSAAAYYTGWYASPALGAGYLNYVSTVGTGYGQMPTSANTNMWNGKMLPWEVIPAGNFCIPGVYHLATWFPGRFYGIKGIGRQVSSNAAPNSDNILLNVDANGWLLCSGTSTDFWVNRAENVIGLGYYAIPK